MISISFFFLLLLCGRRWRRWWGRCSLHTHTPHMPSPICAWCPHPFLCLLPASHFIDCFFFFLERRNKPMKKLLFSLILSSFLIMSLNHNLKPCKRVGAWIYWMWLVFVAGTTDFEGFLLFEKTWRQASRANLFVVKEEDSGFFFFRSFLDLSSSDFTVLLTLLSIICSCLQKEKWLSSIVVVFYIMHFMR